MIYIGSRKTTLIGEYHVLSLAIISKDGKQGLERILSQVDGHVDEIVVVLPPNDPSESFLKEKGVKVHVEDFTQPIEPKIRKKMVEWGVDVPKGYKIFKFAEARNKTLELASGDYYFWLDDDDSVVGVENIRKIIDMNKNIDVFDAVYDYGKDEEGHSISDHVRERIVRHDGRMKWVGGELGLIHETMTPKEGVNLISKKIPKNIFYVDHNSEHMEQSSNRNLIALLYEYLKTDGKDARTIYYLGNELFNRGRYGQCIDIMTKYISVGGWDEEKYRAWLYIAESYRLLKDSESARNAYLSATKELPDRPDAYIGIGETYFDDDNFKKSIEFTMTGLSKKIPDTKSAVDITKYTFRPMVYLALCYAQTGKTDLAYKWFSKARAVNPNHEWIEDYNDYFEDIKDLDEYVKAFVKLGQISQRLYPKTLNKLAEAVPEELQDQEILRDFKWRYTKPKVWSSNSIVYFCSSAFEDWDASSLKTGCGGSEEAVIHLTKRWVEMGYEVTVYNNCKTEGIVDGVNWVRYEKFNPRDLFNVIISWRNNLFAAYNVVAKHKIIDMHDVPSGPYYTLDNLKGVDLFVKSNYHKSLFNLPDDKFTIIPNGIEVDKFKGGDKVKNSVLWTSSYDRGLENLLTIWPDVIKEVPDATLDVYYGFNLFDSMPQGKSKEGKLWKQKMLKLLDQPGVKEHGRVGSETIIEATKRADVFAYPTDFPEISCITAMKMQAGGAIPITSGFAALKETILFPEPTIDITNENGLNIYKEKLINILKLSRDEKSNLRTAMKKIDKFDWNTIARSWDEKFKS